MARAGIVAMVFVAGLLFIAQAQAGPPVVVAGSATDIQGVSALLTGTVTPGGQSTTYSFQYVDQASFEASGFAGAIGTPDANAGSGTEPRHVAAAISGLHPDTAYRYRLFAHNSAGSVASAPAAFTTTHGFGFLPGTSGFKMSARADGGALDTVSGSHPYALSAEIGLNLGGEFEGQPGALFSDGDLRDLKIELPPGLFENPAALPECSLTEFHVPRSSPFEASASGESCPEATQVGTVELETSTGGGTMRRFGVFNLEAPAGVPAQLGFAPYGVPIALRSHIRGTQGDYGLTFESTDFPQTLDLIGLKLTLWGTPWSVAHDGERGDCLNEAEPDFPWAKCSVGDSSSHPRVAYLTLPTFCGAPLTFTARASAWQQPTEVSSTYTSEALQDCGELLFGPFAAGQLTDRKASSASGFQFNLLIDDEALLSPGKRVASQPRRAVVALPEGVTINPSVGAGLGVCTPAQYAAETATSQQGSGCPNAAKIGDFTVSTPLFGEPLEGAIYLAQPDDPATPAPGAENPFDSLIAVYLVARSSQRGVLVEVAGKLVPDPATGRLTASFENLPQLPYSELQVNFRSGQRAPLITPAACGPASTQIELVPWLGSLAPVHVATGWQIESGAGGAPCPAGTPPFSPGVTAGSVNSNIGSYTPFHLHLTRKDTEQEITSYSAVLPKGITGKLAGIPFCPDAAIGASRARAGAAETANPSCPAASEIGHVLSGYGVGAALTYASGKIYLAGPYHGSPLSIVTINAATVGPFDLGTIVIRSAFEVDPETAQLRIDARGSDPIPHIVDGIPLHLRDVRIYIDRPQFTHNPTSCEPSKVISTLNGSGARFEDPGDDSTATVSNHFQLLNCRTLGFRPKLGLRLRGSARRGAYPSLRATFAARSGDANLERIGVTMPHSEFLAQNHIREVCTQRQFAAEACPAASVYGRAVAYTPLFDEPLSGPVYLRSSSHRLPDLVASLHSGAIHIVLDGRIGPAKNGIRAFFTGLPDAPLTRFVLTMAGGRRGLLINSANICAVPPIATVKALAQNNVGAVFTTKLRGQCAKKKTPHRRGRVIR